MHEIYHGGSGRRLGLERDSIGQREDHRRGGRQRRAVRPGRHQPSAAGDPGEVAKNGVRVQRAAVQQGLPRAGHGREPDTALRSRDRVGTALPQQLPSEPRRARRLLRALRRQARVHQPQQRATHVQEGRHAQVQVHRRRSQPLHLRRSQVL